jgi:phospholysine phosphohistidine inorganic pyrophosphate phosphatase
MQFIFNIYSHTYFYRKYYKDKDGLTLDVGAFAKALEFSSGVKPRVIGKPDPSFFLAAVEDMNLSPSEVCI